jgi:hypothetical protein
MRRNYFMPWFRDLCGDAACGMTVGIINGVFGTALFTAEEAREIENLKKLAISVAEKAPKLVTDSATCDLIKDGQKLGLESFVKNAPKEAVTAGVVAAAELVCTKSFKARFSGVLMGACLNLVGC